jgi:hypothetical protein
MPRWRFWEKPRINPVLPSTSLQPTGRFNLPPRDPVSDPALAADPERAAALQRLLQRRESARYDLEQAEAALRPENRWREQVALLDEAIAAVDRERQEAGAARGSPGRPLPAIPVTEIHVDLSPPQSVAFAIGAERFALAEPLDWAERGFQVVRGDLELREGRIEALIPDAFGNSERDALRDHLAQSLLAFATDLRDRSESGQSLPEAVSLADLARPAATHGSWVDWLGRSPAEQRIAARRLELEAELSRLRAERDKELADEARWAERVPIARRRLAQVDAEIAALEGSS